MRPIRSHIILGEKRGKNKIGFAAPLPNQYLSSQNPEACFFFSQLHLIKNRKPLPNQITRFLKSNKRLLVSSSSCNFSHFTMLAQTKTKEKKNCTRNPKKGSFHNYRHTHYQTGLLIRTRNLKPEITTKS